MPLSDLKDHPLYQEPPKKHRFEIEYCYMDTDTEVIEALDEQEAQREFYSGVDDETEILKIKDLGPIKEPEDPNQTKLNLGESDV